MVNTGFYMYLLMAFMILGSVIAVETSDLLSSVICLGAVGFALAVVDLLVGAPDLAIPHIVVEVLVLVILIRVVVTRRDQHHATSRETLPIAATMLCLAGVLVVCALCFAQPQMHPFGEPLFAQAEVAGPARPLVGPGVARDYLEKGTLTNQNEGGVGSANVVMGVLLDYRAYDTLGEATVIFTSIIGAYAVLRVIGRKKKRELKVDV